MAQRFPPVSWSIHFFRSASACQRSRTFSGTAAHTHSPRMSPLQWWPHKITPIWGIHHRADHGVICRYAESASTDLWRATARYAAGRSCAEPACGICGDFCCT